MIKKYENDDFKKVVVDSSKYGELTIYISNNVKIGNSYFVTTTINGKELAGFIDSLGNEIIPFDEMELDEYFTTNKEKDICFGFKLNDTDILKYYHLKEIDNKYRIIISTDPYCENPISIHRIKEYPNYWLFQKEPEENEYIEFAIYNPNENRMITPFFNELSFHIDKNENGHFAYFANYVYSLVPDIDDNEKEVMHTTVCGFIDINGNFSSQILDCEDGELYNSYFLGSSSTSNEYYSFLVNIREKYLNRYNEHEELLDRTINYLFNNYNQSSRPKNINYREKAKILDFNLKNKKK